MRTLRVLATNVAVLGILSLTAATTNASTFEIHLEGFSGNEATRNIGYVRMVVDVDGSSPWQLESSGIASACTGWSESTGSGFINGPSVFLSAHDALAASSRLYVDYPLGDGRMFWMECTAPVVGLSQIYFWKAPDIGDWDANQFGSLVHLVELTASRAVFSTVIVSNENSSWGRVKGLYR